MFIYHLPLQYRNTTCYCHQNLQISNWILITILDNNKTEGKPLCIMSCAKDVYQTTPYNSLSQFSTTLLIRVVRDLQKQIFLFNATARDFSTSYTTLATSTSLPQAEAAEMECLERISRAETLLDDFRHVLEQVDVDLLVKLYRNQTQMCVDREKYTEKVTADQIRGLVEAECQWFWEWYEVVGRGFGVDERRADVWRCVEWKSDEFRGTADEEEEEEVE
ncbi:hypothetical protein CC80DRAFT_586123 [Byssothecium circinans]|uniref:Uncharacterized protein n=1 Tax=Byssothecium circinans TaxID=147558 RepID=A0A6A5T8X9_9PLEO|nr:hypothetical protein CC80DRAFT_586161 [Byssothecium circinans]KAF1948239.1 hypothetical protein CC80DRAFT_586123 [Byssothecium circinans]